MKLSVLSNLLKQCHLFSKLSDIKLDPIKAGVVFLAHVDKKDYIVKTVRDNEKQTLQNLVPLGLDLLPKCVCFELLKDNVYVYEYIKGEELKVRELEASLIQSYAKMQNLLPKDQDSIKKQERQFYRNGLIKNSEKASENIEALKSVFSDELARIIDIFDYLFQQSELIADKYSNMPFAWLHHDFKENNIVGSPQRLIDWGSSYGHGPYLYDLAPFLINDKKSLDLFVKSSDICNKHEETDIKNWLSAALGARFFNLIAYRLGENSLFTKSKKKLTNFVEYEYKTYSYLSTYSFSDK